MGNADSKQKIKDSSENAMMSLKKQMSTSTGMGIKVSDPTIDPAYDELHHRLAIVPKNVETFRKCYKNVNDSWAALKQANITMASAGKSLSSGDEWDGYYAKVEQWDVSPVDYVQDSSPLHAYDKELAEYATMLKDCQKVISKREKAQRELDFWRGQLEQLEAQNKEENLNKIQIFREEIEKARPTFAQANDEAIHAMQEVLARGEELLKSSARALLQAQETVCQGFPADLDA